MREKAMTKRSLISILVFCALLGVFGALLFSHFENPPKAHAASQFANIVCDNFKPISSAASLQIITAGNANMFIYICAEQFGSIGGSTFSIVEGTGATCVTNTAAMVGGTTGATGIGLAANGVITTGSGTGAITRTAVAGDNVCIIMAGAGPLAGAVAWTTAPF
jgi:hypothetical protein